MTLSCGATTAGSSRCRGRRPSTCMRSRLVRPDGTRALDLRWDEDENEGPVAGWLTPGDYIYTVSRPHDRARPTVAFHSSTDGSPAGAAEIAPSEVLPERGHAVGSYIHVV